MTIIEDYIGYATFIAEMLKRGISLEEVKHEFLKEHSDYTFWKAIEFGIAAGRLKLEMV